MKDEIFQTFMPVSAEEKRLMQKLANKNGYVTFSSKQKITNYDIEEEDADYFSNSEIEFMSKSLYFSEICKDGTFWVAVRDGL